MKNLLINGINPPISNVDYHSDSEYLSSSSLKLLLDNPEKFHKEKILGIKEDKKSNAMEEGSYVHAAILEPHTLNEDFAYFSGFRKQGKEWEAFKAATPIDKIILSASQLHRCQAYVNAVKARPEAAFYLKGTPEQAICTELFGVKVKMKADILNQEHGFISDLKTTSQPAGKDNFKLAIQQFSYDLSAALYCMIAENELKKVFDFYFIPISKPDLVCDIYKTSKKTLETGKLNVIRALEIYKKCKETGIWTLPSNENSGSMIKDEPTYIIEEI